MGIRLMQSSAVVETVFGQSFQVPTDGKLYREDGKYWVKVPDAKSKHGVMDWPVFKVNGVEV